jgi:hypothetical protein
VKVRSQFHPEYRRSKICKRDLNWVYDAGSFKVFVGAIRVMVQADLLGLKPKAESPKSKTKLSRKPKARNIKWTT